MSQPNGHDKDHDHDHVGCCEADSEEIFVFTDDEGQERQFFLAELVPFEGQEYAVFLPVEEEEDAETETLAILRVVEDEEGNQDLVDIESDEEFERVADAWEAMLDEEEGEEEQAE